VNRFGAAISGGRELHIGAMFVDMRGSTDLRPAVCPTMHFFLFDRYIHAVTRAIRQNSGLTTSIAGDGIMSVFGIDRPPPMAAREVLQAAFDVWVAVDALNDELSSELCDTASDRNWHPCRHGYRRISCQLTNPCSSRRYW